MDVRSAMSSLPNSSRINWKERMFSARALRLTLASIVVGAVAAAGGWWGWIKPQRDVARLRYETASDVLRLYGLQIRYKQAKGVYASDLDALLALRADGADIKARMGGHLDLSTLVVSGDARKFKIEANVLDPERTLIKIRGPIRDRPAPRAEMNAPREVGVGVDGDGRPIAPPSAPAASARAPRRP